jgi:hypothetical protein
MRVTCCWFNDLRTSLGHAQSWIPAARNVNECNRQVIAHLFFRGGFHIGRAVNSWTGTSIGLLTNNQEIVQVIRIRWTVCYTGSRATRTRAGYCCCQFASGNTLWWVLLLVWCGASGKTLYWVLLLVYVGASGDTRTSLGIVVSLCGASGDTLC